MTRVAILDDYQGVARRMADWNSLAGTEVVVFADHLKDTAAVGKGLDGGLTARLEDLTREYRWGDDIR